MKAYYAHSIALYGSRQEELDISNLETLGFEVVNPNSPKNDRIYKNRVKKGLDGMAHFLDLVSDCDLLAFRANPDGSINAGIMKEIEEAKDNWMPIIELPYMIGSRGLSLEATQLLLKESGAR